MEFRIGERDPVTGLYQVIWPDGGMTLNGMKIFNAEHRVGDVVQATRRSDGMMILDGLKAADVTIGLAGSAVPGSKSVGYLRGQVWNDEEEPKKYSIELVYSPPTGNLFKVKRNDSIGSIVIAVSLDYAGISTLEPDFESTPVGIFAFRETEQDRLVGYYLVGSGISTFDARIRFFNGGNPTARISLIRAFEVKNNTIDLSEPDSLRYIVNTQSLTIFA